MRTLLHTVVWMFAWGPVACSSLPEPPCLVSRSDTGSAYLVQLRPRGDLPAGCPQGQQYQVLIASLYPTFGKSDPPPAVAFQIIGSTVDPQTAAQATGRFTTFLTPPGSDVCTIPELTPAIDDRAKPVNAPNALGPTTYSFSEMKVLSDAAHRGNQFEASAVVDYGIPGCDGLQYVAQAVFPITPCLEDSICLPDPVPTDPIAPEGRGNGSQLSLDYRAFCNLDPALLDNPEMTEILGTGRGVYPGADGEMHDMGVCFLSEPFPSQCPSGSTLSTTGPCVVGPGSNPH